MQQPTKTQRRLHIADGSSRVTYGIALCPSAAGNGTGTHSCKLICNALNEQQFRYLGIDALSDPLIMLPKAGRCIGVMCISHAGAGCQAAIGRSLSGAQHVIVKLLEMANVMTTKCVSFSSAAKAERLQDAPASWHRVLSAVLAPLRERRQQ